MQNGCTKKKRRHSKNLNYQKITIEEKRKEIMKLFKNFESLICSFFEKFRKSKNQILKKNYSSQKKKKLFLKIFESLRREIELKKDMFFSPSDLYSHFFFISFFLSRSLQK